MTVNQVLEALKAGTISIEEASKLLPSNEGPARSLSCKVSEKGAVSVYGLQARFPVTLYKDQWIKLLNFADELKTFMETNKAKLSVKPAKS